MIIISKLLLILVPSQFFIPLATLYNMVIFARIFLLIIFLNISLGCEKPKILPCIKAKVIPFRHNYF